MKIILSFILLSCSFIAAATQDKEALIIGNGAYKFAAPLKNPVNDALDIAKTVKKLGFKTRLLTDASKQEIEQAIESFIAKLKENKGVGLFYYAGHGSQLEGDNYLIPVDTYVEAEKELRHKGYKIAKLLNEMKQANNATNIIILDACRDNPFAGGFKTASRSLGGGTESSRGLRRKGPKLSSGLSKLDAPPNTLLAYATAPGKVAKDGADRNSPYTTMLIDAMQKEGITVEQVFKEVRSKVLEETKGEQVPWESSSLVSDFYFVEKREIPVGW